MKIYVAHANHYDFKEKLYQPIKESNLINQHTIVFPHDEDNKNIKSKEIIQQSNLLIAEVSFPATGLGIEIGWAESFRIPILCISQKGKEYSSSLKFITNSFLEYENEVDMIDKIEKFLKNRERK